MLVPNQTFLVKINSNNLEHYKSKGYECNKGDEIIVRAEDLTKGSHQKVKIICDGCGEGRLDQEGIGLQTSLCLRNGAGQEAVRTDRPDCDEDRRAAGGSAGAA